MLEELKNSRTVTAMAVIGLVFVVIGMLGSFVPCLGSLAFSADESISKQIQQLDKQKMNQLAAAGKSLEELEREAEQLYREKEAKKREANLLAREKKQGQICIVESEDGHGGIAWGTNGDECDKSIMHCQGAKGVNCAVSFRATYALEGTNLIHVDCGLKGSNDFSGLGATPFENALAFAKANGPGCKLSLPKK